jgi:hypothetical protein
VKPFRAEAIDNLTGITTKKKESDTLSQLLHLRILRTHHTQSETMPTGFSQTIK